MDQIELTADQREAAAASGALRGAARSFRETLSREPRTRWPGLLRAAELLDGAAAIVDRDHGV